jgi:hypothetical protein
VTISVYYYAFKKGEQEYSISDRNGRATQCIGKRRKVGTGGIGADTGFRRYRIAGQGRRNDRARGYIGRVISFVQAEPMRRRRKGMAAARKMTCRVGMGNMGMGQGGIAEGVLCIRLALEIEKGLYKEKDGIDREKQGEKQKPM